MFSKKICIKIYYFSKEKDDGNINSEVFLKILDKDDYK